MPVITVKLRRCYTLPQVAKCMIIVLDRIILFQYLMLLSTIFIQAAPVCQRPSLTKVDLGKCTLHILEQKICQ